MGASVTPGLQQTEAGVYWRACAGLQFAFQMSGAVSVCVLVGRLEAILGVFLNCCPLGFETQPTPEPILSRHPQGWDYRHLLLCLAVGAED